MIFCKTLIVFLFSTLIYPGISSEIQTKIPYFTKLDEYNSFIRKFDRNYNSSEYWYRYHIFEKNMDYIGESNKKDKPYKLGVNNFTDMTLGEFKNVYLRLNISANSISHKSNYRYIHKSIPQNIDWRAGGLVTNVKDQGQCGSCWAFSAIGTLEGQHAKKYGSLVSLSEQNLVDCAYNYTCQGCDGGWPDMALQYVIDNKGVDTEIGYPYQAIDESCNYTNSSIGANATKVVRLPAGNMTMLYNAIGNIGPISVALDAEADFQMYSSGIFNSTECSSEMLDHAVLAIGYGVLNGSRYLIIKNSWGASWGMNGYIYFSTSIDNMCGIAQHTSYPVV